MATLLMGNVAKYQPEFAYSGNVTALFDVSASLSVSGGNVMVIGKIPHGAIPLAAVWYGDPATTGFGTFVAKFGTSASLELFFGSATYSGGVNAVSTRQLGTAMQISLSDDAAVRYDYVTMVTTAGASLGHLGELAVTYRMPGQRKG